MTMVIKCDCCGNVARQDGITRRMELRNGANLTGLDMCQGCHDIMIQMIRERFTYIVDSDSAPMVLGTTPCHPGCHDFHLDRLDGNVVFRCTKCGVVTNDERRV